MESPTSTANVNIDPNLSTTSTTNQNQPSTGDIVVPAQSDEGLKSYNDVLFDLLKGLKIDEEQEKNFFEFLSDTFKDKSTTPTTEYEIKDLKQSLTFGKELIQKLYNDLSALDSALSSPFEEMVKNLVKVQIYSYIEKKGPAAKEDENERDKYKSMFQDLIKLVNDSLSQTNGVFENRFSGNNQSGGGISSKKISTMSKYFKYKLKYMMKRRELGYF